MSEELMIRHCSPTLAGLKTGSLFTCRVSTQQELRDGVRTWNRRLSGKGVRMLPLRYAGCRALIYIYRPAKLKRDLGDGEACRLLESRGYTSLHPERCIVQLIQRLRGEEDFPHEIGLFLGYPPEDVMGFMENKAGQCKCAGCWKVYGDPCKAEKIFAQYKKCTAVYYAQWANGKSVERLTVAV